MQSRGINVNETSVPQFDFHLIVHGGNKQSVREKITTHLNVSDDAEFYQTWTNVAMLRRLRFLFSGGVESAMGLFEVVCMFAVLVLTLILFFFWQTIVFAIVLLVLAVFSGGAALKYVKGTYLGTNASDVDFDSLEQLTIELTQLGGFVYVNTDASDSELGPVTRTASRNAKLFRSGISLALLIATVFLIYEVVYRILLHVWSTDILILAIFGLLFLASIVVMDMGVILNHRLKKSI